MKWPQMEINQVDEIELLKRHKNCLLCINIHNSEASKNNHHWMQRRGTYTQFIEYFFQHHMH